MDKEKEINEMAKIVPHYATKEQVARSLYDAGYRNCKALLEENERLVHDHNIMFDALQEAQKMAKEMISEENIKKIETEVKEIKQQAIKEFAEAIKLNFRPYVVREFSTNYEINSDLVIDDLLKNYGVELDKE